MDTGKISAKNFLVEMSEYTITAREFFSDVLLDSIKRNFGYSNVVITYFDTTGGFLSWVTPDGIKKAGSDHPYTKFVDNDSVRSKVYQDALRDHLTYFNVDPRLYRATDIIEGKYYDNSPFVDFIEKNFGAHYALTLAFGINAYIMVTFLKSNKEGDFTAEEMEIFRDIYIFIAEAYKNFKKYEQRQIVTNIQNEIVSSGEKAYLITDDFMHVMGHNDLAVEYLEDILGKGIDEWLDSSKKCDWLPFLLGSDDNEHASKRVQMSVIKGYVFKVYTYDQTYSNGIIDRYHWITISKKSGDEPVKDINSLNLTDMEQKVANLLYKGLTYKAIADELVISYHTVKKHVENIYCKCGVKSRYELYKLMENGSK
jgi:DNA-binding CsgD family transcriptional regulator